MNLLAALTASAAALGLVLYWLLRFRWVLPLEERSGREERTRRALEEILQSLSRAAAPSTPGVFREALADVLRRLEILEPGLHHWIFEQEASPRRWVLWTQGGSRGLAGLRPPVVLESSLAEGLPEGPYPLSKWLEKETSPEGFFHSLAAAGLRGVHVRHLRSENAAALGGRGLWIVGLPDDGSAPPGSLYANVGPALAALWANAQELWALRRREGELRQSIAVTIQELTSTNVRLTQRSREMKTLHELARTLAANPANPSSSLSALVAIIAKALGADLCAFLLLDEQTGELVTQAGAYGVAGDEVAVYRLPLTNSEASSVRVVLTGRPFMTGDAREDFRAPAQFARLWKANSLIVVPLKIEDRAIGVLRIGSFRENFFSEDHLRFAMLIAEETAVIIESAMLLQKTARTAQESAGLNRMKDEFISTVSREFGPPLTSIQGFLSVLLSGEAGPLEERQERCLRLAANASARLGVLLADLLDVSRLEAGQAMDFKPVDLGEILRRGVEAHAPQARETDIDLRVSFPEVLPKIWGDQRWLAQAVENLISNAIKFTQAGGSVLVSAREKGDTVLAWVSDTGIGIPIEERGKVFEKFYRVRSTAGSPPPGTGLGLAIVKRVIEGHQGKVWLESEVGRGSKFSFALPAVRAVPEGKAAPADIREGPPA